VQALAAKAKERDVYIAAGLTEHDPATNKLYNSTVLVGPDGQVVTLYRKHFLIGYDKRWATPGDNGFPVVDTALGRIGAFICADARIPEVTRCPAVDGAEILVNTSNWGGTDQYDVHVPARAAENRVWVVAANKSGRDQPGKANVGHSLIVNPNGEVISEAGNSGPEIIYGLVDIESSADKTWGNTIDLLETRRPELYSILELPMDETPLVSVLQERVRPDEITAAVSAVQVSFTTDADATLALALEYVDQARHRNYTDLVVLPELFLFRPQNIQADVQASARFSQQALDAFRPLCALGNMYAVLSVVEQADGAAYSSAYLLHPDGHVDRYRKTHLTPTEARWATAGTELPVFRTRFGNVGLMLGHEGVIPEVARSLTLGGADLICWPTSWLNPLEFTLLATERVLENRISLAISNRLDSAVAGPSLILQGLLSRSLSSAARWETTIGEPGFVTGLLNLAMSRSKRIYSNTDVLLHRQPQYYAPLTRMRTPRGPLVSGGIQR
jgi:predicted amidohydrolase